MITTTATDIQNNFGKYLKAVQEGNEIIILKKGKEKSCNGRQQERRDKKTLLCIYANGGQWLDALLCITRTGSTTVI